MTKSLWRKAGWILLAAVVGYGSDWFSMRFTLPGSFVSIAYPNMGLMVAIGILVGPWIAIGAFLGEMALQAPMTGTLPAFGFATAGALQVFLIAYGVRRWFGGAGTFATRAGVARFAVGAGLIGTTVSATGGVATLLMAGFIGPSDLLLSWATWWAADVVSVLVLTPLVVLLVVPSAEDPGPLRERLLVLMAVGFTAAVVLAVPTSRSTFALALLGLPIVGWTAFRLCRRFVATVSTILAVVAFAQLAVPWRQEAPDIVALLEAQVFIAFVSVLGLVVAASLREERVRLAAAAKDRFDAINATRNKLLHSFAHELNNPLTPMLLQLELLKHTMDPTARDKVERVSTIHRNTLRLSKLVRDLRDVTHLQSGDRLRMSARRIDLVALAEEVVDSYAGTALAANVTLRVDAPPSAPVFADPDRLAQVLGNLLDNAIKYSPKEGEVAVVVRLGRGEVMLEVQDKGCGLERSQIARLFQPFGQVHSDAEQRAGTGLGLHIARGIVETHGGTLECQSEGRGKGSSFAVRLPAPADLHATPQGVAAGVLA